MPARRERSPTKPAGAAGAASIHLAVQEALAALKRLGTKRTLEEMPRRYGIFAKKAFGVKVGDIQRLAKGIGQSHELALAMWDTGWYEARMLASFVDQADRVTPAQMDRWCRDFDNWGICDTVCFKLFDRVPAAWQKAPRWAASSDEFIKRGGYVLMACLAAHDKAAPDKNFLPFLPRIEKGAADERNFVKKGVNWALRGIGRRSLMLNAAAVLVARRLAESPAPAPRWVGKDALRELTSPAVQRGLAKRAGKSR